jgi:2-polyprenyl-3-methyl-5-hydroxy-6-metoxy-1,4-benzoquinol methylase
MPIRFQVRQQQPELMDDPGLDQQTHRHALDGLRRINWLSQTDTAIWTAISFVLSKRVHGRTISVLDVASGGGDLAIGLARRFQQAGIPAHIQGCDISPTAIEYAEEKARAANVSSVEFLCCNALEDAFPFESYDIVMSSLFLHHLSQSDAVRLLSRMKAVTRQLLLVDDLRRTGIGYWLAWLGCRILTRCHVVHYDGPVSVAGAFTSSEAVSMALSAGLSTASVTNHWPQRFLLSWHPDSAAIGEED